MFTYQVTKVSYHSDEEQQYLFKKIKIKIYYNKLKKIGPIGPEGYVCIAKRVIYSLEKVI